MKNLTTISLFLAFCLSLVGQPNYFNYQGVLKDVNGLPLDDGGYTLEFNIYDAPIDGNLIWGPFILDGTTGVGHAPQAQLLGGQFNIILGPADTASRGLADAFQSDSTFIQIAVNGGAPITPRQQILSAPYAFSATNAATLDKVAPVQYRNPPGTMVMFAGTADKVPEGWLLCDGSEYDVSMYPDLYAAIGNIWGGRQVVDLNSVVTNYFNVPDMRGMFPRGANLGRTDAYKDVDATSRQNAQGLASEDAGTLQADRLAEHRHIWSYADDSNNDVSSWNSNGAYGEWLNRVGDLQISEVALNDFDYQDNYNDVNGGNRNLYTKPGSTENDTVDPIETRPNNAAVNFIIKL